MFLSWVGRHSLSTRLAKCTRQPTASAVDISPSRAPVMLLLDLVDPSRPLALLMSNSAEVLAVRTFFLAFRRTTGRTTSTNTLFLRHFCTPLHKSRNLTSDNTTNTSSKENAAFVRAVGETTNSSLAILSITKEIGPSDPGRKRYCQPAAFR